jgi:hypothetical protein
MTQRAKHEMNLQKENNLPAEKPEVKDGEASEEAADKMKEDAQALIDAGKRPFKRPLILSIAYRQFLECSGTSD